MSDINWKIGGVGGMGAMGIGFMFSKMAQKLGYFVTDYTEYNSIIKGGHNTYQSRISDRKIFTISRNLNILIALDQASLSYLSELDTNFVSYVICDLASVKDIDIANKESVIDIPFSMLNKQYGGDEIMKNMIALGASCAFLSIPKDIYSSTITEQFIKKGEEIILKNIELFEVGMQYVRDKYMPKLESFYTSHGKFEQVNNNEKYLMAGNEAIAIAAIRSNIGFYSAYPMTPSSSILHYLAPLAQKYNMIVKQAEDEIAAINSAIGASYAGVRSMVATSGGGFSLMTEGLGLAAITETPIVICVVSRPGPATGLPTWTDQGDLRFLIHASQGEFLRIVFTPGDPHECSEYTNLAFYLAEKYHIPVIIVSDKYLAESRWSCYMSDSTASGKRNGFVTQIALQRMDKYLRYQDTVSGVTPRSIPGMEKGEYVANSDEHDEYGLSNEDVAMRNMQINKRYTKKIKNIMLEMPKLKEYGNSSAKLGVISFGSVKNQILESLKSFTETKFLHISHVSPFPAEEVQKFIAGVDKFAVIENNLTNQLVGLIKENCMKEADYKYAKDDGRIIYHEELTQFLKQNGYK